MTMGENLWAWQTADGIPYLTCTLLAPWPHGFFTRGFYPRLPEVLINYLDPQGTAFRVKQVHGDVSLTAREISQTPAAPNSVHPPADGVISDAPHQGVWVASADCTPVLIGDVITKRVAAVHAGWRGTKAKIVPKTIDKFLALGSELKDLRIALGPAIAGEVYQVDPWVALGVSQSLEVVQRLPTEERQWDYLYTIPNPPVLPDGEPEKCRLDVRRVNQLQLLELGLTPAQVAVAPHCTFQGEELFFSYRRTHTKEVQWSGIVSG
ncbi:MULTISPECIES: peptidoglycan editing factor PgeF [unclassified Synechocystis]|uniref:peptidoglycan editing factor PgeF n=1 Tax=unclassified Synechocystis TaxID=2640012 RepID=UPI00048A9C0E|nr:MULTISPECIES: peptidoglycan editing factor PgeF [unclassified Synechocystis]MCT0253940.1 peptidoglycan editing factor PgeF [Synechocystis sp. CS-94]